MEQNWAGNITYTAPQFRKPGSIAEAQEMVRAASHVRALGSRHSFNDLPDSPDTLLSLAALDKVVSVDHDARQVTVEGGIRYGDLVPTLDREGLALANLASLPHISVAGAVTTATHGSGSTTGNLATAVAAMDLITADGDITTLTRAEGDRFDGAVVGLGALGVIARLTLDVEPTYDVRQTVYTGLTHDVLADEFDDIFAAATSVSVFTSWAGEETMSLWLKDRVTDETTPPETLFGARQAEQPMHPLPTGRASDCTEQLGRPGPWHARLPHFRMEFSPSNGAEIQAEYFFPREEAARAIAAMRKHGERLAPILFTSEIRTVAADTLWLSPGHRGDYLGFHFTFHRDWEALKQVLPPMEADLIPLGAIPHWGKVTTMDPAIIRSRYARMDDFRDLARSFDPDGKFRNAYLDRMIFDA